MGGGKKARLPQIYYTYPAIMNFIIPYLRKLKKCINHARHPVSPADIKTFQQKPATFVVSRNTDIDCTFTDSSISMREVTRATTV